MQYRIHVCSCGHTWEQPITLSEHTSNLSGEVTPWCPKCGKRAVKSSEVKTTSPSQN